MSTLRRRRAWGTGLALGVAVCGLAGAARAYPTDAGERTGIRRLAWQRAIDADERRGRKDPPGAQWPSDRIALRMLAAGHDFDLGAQTPKDSALQAALETLLRRTEWRQYHVALLDITEPATPRFAAVRETEPQTPGSVAKVLIAAGMLRELRQRFPDDVAARERLLREAQVSADAWAMPNHHEVPVVEGTSAAVRPVRVGDRFSLWEWMDHALSPSSNAAATMLWREATLMHLLAAGYPPAVYDAPLWQRWTKADFTTAAFEVVDAPLVEAGLDPQTFLLRLFFTRGASSYVQGDTSRVTPLALVQWLLRVEQGRMVDAFSSLELKRMLYLTRRRIRYAKSPALRDAAVFFKSGSLYQCQPEAGYTCAAYEGNAVNVLNSLVEVETAAVTIPEDAKNTAPARNPVYIVGVMSNELKTNAADAHERLASAIHELMLR